MARREVVTDRNDTNVRSRNKRSKDEVPVSKTGRALPEKFRTERVGEFISAGKSTIAPTGAGSRAVRRATSRLAARKAARLDKPGHHLPGSQKFRG